MKTRNYVSFVYALLSLFLIVPTLKGAIAKPSLENLYAMHLWPTKEVTFKTSMITTIPDLFEKIKQKKTVPAQGNLTVPKNTQNPLWGFKKGLPEKLSTPIFIHSAPRADFLGRLWSGRAGQSLRCTHPWVKNSIINAPFVAFDYFYGPHGFDFGQGVNIDCLDFICTQLKTKNPHAPLVIAGTCIGAKITLEYAAKHDTKAIRALILETPFIDAKKFLHNIDMEHGSWLPFNVQSILKWYFSDSKEPLRKPHADISKIRSDMPIFIAHLDNDAFYKNKEMKELIDQLRKNGNDNVYLLVIKDSTFAHGHVNSHKTFAQASSAFLAQYGLPHNAQLAQEGKSLLALAHTNAKAKNHLDWQTVQSA